MRLLDEEPSAECGEVLCAFELELTDFEGLLAQIRRGNVELILEVGNTVV